MTQSSNGRPEQPLAPRDAAAIDRAWDAFEEEDIEEAVEAVERLMRRTQGHPEVLFLRAVLLLDEGEPAVALEELTGCVGQVDDAELLAYYIALALFDLARFEEAESRLRDLTTADLDRGPVEYQLAQVREHLGRYAEAEAGYARAHAIDADAFPMPLRMTRGEFEEAVQSARALLPENLRARLDEVPVVVEDLPPRDILTLPEGDRLAPDLLGLFVGRNLREESVFEVPGLPAAIYIYQRNLERVCGAREELVGEIGTTLYHELGHYLGLEEDDLRDLGVD
jgi:predicted Zn-dependent protease with MMP-like domain